MLCSSAREGATGGLRIRWRCHCGDHHRIQSRLGTRAHVQEIPVRFRVDQVWNLLRVALQTVLRVS